MLQKLRWPRIRRRCAVIHTATVIIRGQPTSRWSNAIRITIDPPTWTPQISFGFVRQVAPVSEHVTPKICPIGCWSAGVGADVTHQVDLPAGGRRKHDEMKNRFDTKPVGGDREVEGHAWLDRCRCCRWSENRCSVCPLRWMMSGNVIQLLKTSAQQIARL